jgi:hypothetical protein
LSLSRTASAADNGYDDAEISKGIFFINQRSNRRLVGFAG